MPQTDLVEPSHKVPISTNVLLVSIMLLFFVSAVLFTLQARWAWWIIAAVIAIPIVTILSQRNTARLRRKAAARVGPPQ